MMSPDANGHAGRPSRKEPSLNPPRYVLNRHGGRVLDPESAVRTAAQPAVRPTVYVGGQLLVRDRDLETVRPLMARVLERLRLRARYLPVDQELYRLAERHGLQELADRILLHRIALANVDHEPAAPPDAWVVLQEYRAQFRKGEPAAEMVTLEHLLSGSGVFVSGNPFMQGGPFM